jgi:hypothetical protein
VDVRLFGKALAVQTGAVALLFAVLLALPLPEDFFEDAGFATGPLGWAACSVVTARVLSLTPALAVSAAVAGGLAGAVAFVAINHGVGMVAALLSFAAVSAMAKEAAFVTR